MKAPDHTLLPSTAHYLCKPWRGESSNTGLWDEGLWVVRGDMPSSAPGLAFPGWQLQPAAGPPGHLGSQWSWWGWSGPGSQACSVGWPALCAEWAGSLDGSSTPCHPPWCTFTERQHNLTWQSLLQPVEGFGEWDLSRRCLLSCCSYLPFFMVCLPKRGSITGSIVSSRFSIRTGCPKTTACSMTSTYLHNQTRLVHHSQTYKSLSLIRQCRKYTQTFTDMGSLISSTNTAVLQIEQMGSIRCKYTISFETKSK